MTEQNNFDALSNVTRQKPRKKTNKDTKPAKAGSVDINTFLNEPIKEPVKTGKLNNFKGVKEVDRGAAYNVERETKKTKFNKEVAAVKKEQDKNIADFGEALISAGQKAAYPVTAQPDPNDNFLFTPEYRTEKKLKSLEDTAKKEEEDRVDVRSLYDAEIRSDKTLTRLKTLMDESNVLNDEEEIDLSNEFDNIDKNTLSAERKKATDKLLRDGIELTDVAINSEIENVWKSKRRKEKVYSKQFEFMEYLDGFDDNVSNVLKKYKLNDKAISDIQTAKNVAKADYIKQAVDDDYKRFEKIQKSLKPKDYKFTTQEEVDLENEKILELSNIKNRSEKSIGMLNTLQADYDNLADKSISLKDEVELFNKEWGWWSRTGLKVAQTAAGLGNNIMAAGAFVMDPLAYILTGEENLFGKANAEQKKILDEGFAEILPARREVTDIESLGEFVGGELIPQVPNVIAAWYSGGSSLGVSAFAGTQVTGQKYSDMLNEEKYGYYDKEGNLKLPDYNAAQLFIAPLWAGTSEAASEIAFSRMIGRTKNAVLNKASNDELEIFRKGLDNSYKAISTRMVKNTAENFAEEIPAEIFNNIVQNYGDKVILDKDVDVLDNSLDVLKSTAAISTVFGTAPHVAIAAFKPFMTKSNILELRKNSEELLSLMNNVDYNSLPESEKATIDARISILNKKSNDIINKTTGLFTANSPEFILDLYKKGKDLNDLRKKALTVKNSSSLDPVEKQKTIDALNEEFKTKNANYETMLGEAYATEQIHRRAVGDGIKNKILSFSDRAKATADARRAEAATRMANAELETEGVTKSFSTEELIKGYELSPSNKSAVEAIDTLIENKIADKTLNKDEAALYRKALISEKVRSYGLFYDTGDKIVLNRDLILKDKRFSTGKHEVLHRVVKGITSNMGNIGNTLYDFVKENHIGEKDFAQTEFFTRVLGYKTEAEAKGKRIDEILSTARGEYASGKIDEKTFKKLVLLGRNKKNEAINNANEEIATVLVEALDSKDIVINKAMDVRLDAEGNVLFDDAQDVFNFIVNYSNGYNKSQLTSEGKAVLTGKVVGSLITSKDKQAGGVKESKQLQSLLDKYNGDARKMVNETLAKTPSGNYTSSLTSSALGQELGGIIETITKRLYDPIPADNKEMLSRQEYKEALIGVAATMITNEYKAEKQTLDQFISNRLNLRANSLAKELGIESTQEQGGAGFKVEIDSNKTEGDDGMGFDDDFMSEEEADALIEQAEIDAAEEAAKSPKFVDTIDMNVEIDGKPLIETFNEKMQRNLSFALKRYDEEISKNRTITPFVETLRMEMQEDMYKSFKKLINNHPGGYAQFLTDKKEVLLANYTTTYLAKHPIFRKGIEKRVDGEWVAPSLVKKANGTIEYRWVDEKGNDLKIDRDNAAGRGLTSGPEMIRRNKKINDVLSTKEFVDYHFQDGGLRTKKKQNPEDAVARQLASETALEMFQTDIKADGPLSKMFLERAELLGKIIADNAAIALVKDLDRGLIKESMNISYIVNDIALKGKDNVAKFTDALAKLANSPKLNQSDKDGEYEKGIKYLRGVGLNDNDIANLAKQIKIKSANTSLGPKATAESFFISSFFKDRTVGTTAKQAFKEIFGGIKNEFSFTQEENNTQLAKDRAVVVATIKEKFNRLKETNENLAIDFIENILKLSRGLAYGYNQSILDNNPTIYKELIEGDPLLENNFKLIKDGKKNYIKKKNADGSLTDIKPTINANQVSTSSDFKAIANELIKNKGKIDKKFIDETLQVRKNQEMQSKKDMIAAVDFIKNTFFSKDKKGKLNSEDLKAGFLLVASLFKSTNALGRISASVDLMVKPNNMSDLDGYRFEHRPPVTNIVHSILNYLNGEITKSALEKHMNKMSVILTPKSYDNITDATFKTSTLNPMFLKGINKKLIPAVETAIADYISNTSAPVSVIDLNTAKSANVAKVYNQIMNNVAAEIAIKTIGEASVIKESKAIDEKFNQIIEETTGVEAYKEFSAIVGKRRGASKGKYRLFIPPGAEDFIGLLYDLMGKGKKGEEHKEFFMKHLIEPYTFGVNQIMRTKNAIRREYTQLMKVFPKVKAKLEKKIPSGDFTYDQAIRVYLWDKGGIDIPGLTERDRNKLVDLIKNDTELEQFSGLLSQISRQPEGWLKPDNNWDVDTILSDLNNTTEGSNRKEFLSEFVENSKEMFSDKNKNKLKAIFGNNWVDALEDGVFRMTNGTNRTMGTNKATNAWNNWVNNSTGAIMFFNRRSAILQLLSTFNYLNWSDNNPLNAAIAFANQKQYWADFAMIFNSPMMKERRGGLQMEVSESEIANAAANSKNKAKAVMSYLLKIGFIPTQMADSFAIASGGAPMYRNRVNTYLKETKEDGTQKYNQKEAEDKAFEDFSRTTNESQQSADPMLISQEQASPLGRLILAFQNTTQQYMRLSKKSVRDLINGRGDWKVHVSKIVYYTTIQNIIFNALQAGIFALIPGFGDEDDDEVDDKGRKFTAAEIKKRKEEQQAEKEGDMINGFVDGILRGAGLYGAVAATTKNVILKYMEVEAKEKGMKDYTPVVMDALSISPPIGSKVRKLNQAMKGYNYNRATIAKRGFEVTYNGKPNLSPAWLAAGQATSAVTNFPLDRMYDETNSVIEAFDSRNTALQRTALALGWKDWTVGATNEENDLIRSTAKKEKKEVKEGKKETRTDVRKARVRKAKIRR